MEIVNIAVICIICAILSRVIAQTNQELSILVTIAAVIVIALCVLNSVCDVISKLGTIINVTGVDHSSIYIAFKALGICYICELSSSSCKDCGESALASIIEISGKVAITLICLPLLDTLMNVVKNILEM